MNLLDAVAGPVLILFPILFIVFFAVAVALEGWIIMKFMKRTYKRAFMMSLYANGASLVAGFLSINLIGPPNHFINFVAYFLVTLMVEFGMLLVITNAKEVKEVALSALVMNLASYGVLALAFWIMGEF